MLRVAPRPNTLSPSAAPLIYGVFSLPCVIVWVIVFLLLCFYSWLFALVQCVIDVTSPPPSPFVLLHILPSRHCRRGRGNSRYVSGESGTWTDIDAILDNIELVYEQEKIYWLGSLYLRVSTFALFIDISTARHGTTFLQTTLFPVAPRSESGRNKIGRVEENIRREENSSGRKKTEYTRLTEQIQCMEVYLREEDARKRSPST